MWKALIKLVESWSYRCEHDWEEVSTISVHRTCETAPIAYKYVYRCKKCCESKQIKT